MRQKHTIIQFKVSISLLKFRNSRHNFIFNNKFVLIKFLKRKIQVKKNKKRANQKINFLAEYNTIFAMDFHVNAITITGDPVENTSFKE